MDKIQLYRKMLEEERISEEELLSICTEEELDAIFAEESVTGLTEEKSNKLTEVLTLIQVRDAYMNSTAQIGFHAKKDDPMVEYLHKTMLILLKELYGD